MVKEVAKSYFTLLAIPIVLSVLAFIGTAKELLIPVIFSVLMVALALYTGGDEPQVSIELALSRDRVFVGDEVEVRARVRVKGGFGLLSIALPPASYRDSRDYARYTESLEVTRGNSVHVVFKGFRDLEREYVVRIKALRRGKFEFGLVRYTYHHMFGMRVIEDSWDKGLRLTVLPRYRIIRRGVGRIKPSLVTPRVTPIRLGPHSTDFIEVREYAPGDPFKFINWKASARSTQGKLLSNEYEREGLRTVVFLIDVSEGMRYGLPHENPLEYSIYLILSLAKALIRYGYNIGLWTLPNTGIYVIPSSGQTQFYRLLNALLIIEGIKEPTPEGYLDPGLLRVIAETKPILILLTNIADGQSVRRLRSYLCRGDEGRCRGLGRVLIIDVTHGSITHRELLGEYMVTPCLGATPSRARLYRALPRWTQVVTWDPLCEGVGSLVARLMPRIRWLS